MDGLSCVLVRGDEGVYIGGLERVEYKGCREGGVL